MIPFAHAHRAAGFFQSHRDTELAKRFDKNLRRGERAEIYNGASPVQDDSFKVGRLFVVHIGTPLSLNGSPRRALAMLQGWIQALAKTKPRRRH
ncbi:hypothetical protein D3C81_1812290 [compost metagenome]